MLQQKKELVLMNNMSPESTYYQYTTVRFSKSSRASSSDSVHADWLDNVELPGWGSSWSLQSHSLVCQ